MHGYQDTCFPIVFVFEEVMEHLEGGDLIATVHVWGQMEGLQLYLTSFSLPALCADKI